MTSCAEKMHFFKGTLLRLKITRLTLVAPTQPSDTEAKSVWDIQIAVDCYGQRKKCRFYFIGRLILPFQLQCLILFSLSSPYCTNDKSANDSWGSTEPLHYIKCTQGCSRGERT